MIRFNDAPRSMRMTLEYQCEKQFGKYFRKHCVDNNVEVDEMISFSKTPEGSTYWYDECARIEAILRPNSAN